MGVVLLFGDFLFQWGMFIQDLSQKSFMGPINVIHVVKNVCHMQGYPREFSLNSASLEFL